MRILCLALCMFLASNALVAESTEWKVTKGKVFFKSETDLETILGEGDSVTGSLDLKTKKIKIEIGLGSIKTDNKLQTSHLHDHYFEVEKFPVSTFEGEVTQIKEIGEVEAIGTLQLHGIKKENVKLLGKIEKSPKGVEQISYFSISLSDYKIEIPKLVFLKVNPIIQVKVKIQWETP